MNHPLPDAAASLGSRSLPPLTSHDGTLLFRREWPLAGADKSILLVHGLGEHSGRYEALAEWFRARGYAVSAYDQRGHGQSGGRRGGLPHGDDLQRDLAQVYTSFAETQAKPPSLLGHSMGGLVCARTVLDRRVQPSALILSAPALKSWVHPWLQQLAAVLARIAPGLSLPQGLPKNALSHDPAVAETVKNDPYCHDKITAALANFLFTAGRASIADAGQLAVPTLLLVAGSDRLVDPAGSVAFAEAAPPSLLRMKSCAESYHELFNEVDSLRDRVLAAVADWLDTGR